MAKKSLTFFKFMNKSVSSPSITKGESVLVCLGWIQINFALVYICCKYHKVKLTESVIGFHVFTPLDFVKEVISF